MYAVGIEIFRVFGMFDISVSYWIYYIYHVFLVYMANIRLSSLGISPRLRLGLISQGSRLIFAIYMYTSKPWYIYYIYIIYINYIYIYIYRERERERELHLTYDLFILIILIISTSSTLSKCFISGLTEIKDTFNILITSTKCNCIIQSFIINLVKKYRNVVWIRKSGYIFTTVIVE